MRKTDAIQIFDTITELADACEIERQAVYQWPDILPRRIADRVIGAAVRHGKTIPQSLLCPQDQKEDAA